MALISTEKIYLKSVGEWQKKVTYSKGLFRIVLPDCICEDLSLPDSDKEICASTEEEVSRKFDDKVKEWETSSTEETKVIVFQASFQGGLRLNYEKYEPMYLRGGYGGVEGIHHVFCEKGINHFDESGLGMLIKWSVYSKKTFKGKSKYKYISGRYFDRIEYNGELSSGLTEILYSEEREKYFLTLDESFAKMIAKVYKAFGNLTSEKLEIIAESHTKLIGG